MLLSILMDLKIYAHFQNILFVQKNKFKSYPLPQNPYKWRESRRIVTQSKMFVVNIQFLQGFFISIKKKFFGSKNKMATLRLSQKREGKALI